MTTPVFIAVTALLAWLTFGSLLRSERWWIRALDFPRLELAVWAAAWLAAQAWVLDGSAPISWVLMTVTLSCFAYQAWWIFPFTPFARGEVKQAERATPENRFRLLAANVYAPNRNAQGLIDLVRRYEPDVVVTLETNSWWEDQLGVLERDYPHTLKCPLENLYGMHVYSKLPFERAEKRFLVEPDIPSMHFLFRLRNGQRFRLHCVHPTPPSPTENPSSAERDAELIVVAKSIAKTHLPVVVAGDLNDVAWSSTTRLFRKVSKLLDPRVGRGMFNTFHARFPLFRWPLDHVFHSRDFALERLERLPAFGSDHFPIFASLSFEPEKKAEQPALEADAEDYAWADEKTAGQGAAAESLAGSK